MRWEVYGGFRAAGPYVLLSIKRPAVQGLGYGGGGNGEGRHGLPCVRTDEDQMGPSQGGSLQTTSNFQFSLTVRICYNGYALIWNLE